MVAIVVSTFFVNLLIFFFFLFFQSYSVGYLCKSITSSL